MKNYLATGEHVVLPAPGDVVSGELVIVGNLAGVAVANAEYGAPVTLCPEGVFLLPKRLSSTFTSGGAVSYDVSTKRCDAPGTGRYPVGAAIEPAGNGAGTVKVRLNGTATAPAP